MKSKYRGKKVAVLGFGLEGKDLVKYLLSVGSEVFVYDQKDKKVLDLKGFPEHKIRFICGENYLKQGLIKCDAIFRSPGIYRYLPEIVKAEKKGIEISSAIKLFFDLCPSNIIGVTGTKGKGTTSTLIYQIMKKSGEDVYLAGNIGKPYLELLPKLTKESIVVLELSSFQLIDLEKSPHISVVLNITLDHMDWHKSAAEYLKSKENIVRHQNSSDFSVVNSDYKNSSIFSEFSKGKVFKFSKKNKVRGSYAKERRLILSVDDEHIIGDVSDLKLRGEHNWENVTAAICASYLAGADIDSIKKIVFSFRGLEHRLEEVREVGGVKFYNDSFSTNSDTTIAAIRSFQEPITLILGGSDKGLEYDELASMITGRTNVKVVILIGEILGVFEKALKKANYSGKLLILKKAKINEIVKTAYKNTEKGGVVLLSPATASFDMFENYKMRGKYFKIAVNKL